jgi:enoyl-CoA hydratase
VIATVGKAKAMDLCLTARFRDAAVIAGFSLPVVMMVKESVNRAFESSLNEGLLFERRAFHASFGLEDQKEGMAAFVEKRKANFMNR